MRFVNVVINVFVKNASTLRSTNVLFVELNCPIIQNEFVKCLEVIKIEEQNQE